MTRPRLPAAPPGRWSDLRTQVMAVAAWAAGSAALATALYPVLAASLFAFLVGLVLVISLRTSLRAGLLVAAGAVVPFALADLALTALAADPSAGGLGPGALLAHPAARQPDVLAYLVVGAALLAGSAAVADTASAVLARAGDRPAAAAPSAPGRAEWELARAFEYRRGLALALLGVEAPEAAEEPGRRVRLMADLDELVLDTVSRFDVVAVYGSRERLLALPERSAEALCADADQLCALATERLGRPVRMALLSPVPGAALAELLAELEVGLARCRAGTLPFRSGVASIEALHVLNSIENAARIRNA